MRTATIKLDGQERLLCFSTGMVEQVCEKFGGMDAYFSALDADQTTQIRTVVWSLAQMMKAGEKYAKLKGLETAPAMSEDDIRDLCDVTELLGLRAKVAETITGSTARQVEAEPPKNAEATPEPETAAP